MNLAICNFRRNQPVYYRVSATKFECATFLNHWSNIVELQIGDITKLTNINNVLNSDYTNRAYGA